MRAPHIKEAYISPHTFILKDFAWAAERAYNAVFGEETASVYGLKPLGITVPENASAIYSACGKFVCYADKKIFASSGGSFSPVGITCDTEPIIVGMPDGYGGKILVFSGEKVYTVNADMTFTEKPAIAFTAAAPYCGRLFAASKNELYFSAPFDYTDFTLAPDKGGVVLTSPADGDIVALAPYGQKLLAFCERAVYTFTAFGDRVDYQLVRLDADMPKSRAGTFARAGDGVAFFGEAGLCVYKDGKVTVKDGTASIIPVGRAASSGTAYYLPVVGEDGEKSVFFYDAATSEKCMVRVFAACAADGGYAVGEGGMLSSIEKGAPPLGGCKFVSRKLDFGYPDEKVVTFFALRCSGDAVMKLYGKSEIREYALKEGYNGYRPNLAADALKFSVESADGAVSFGRIKFVYRIRGNRTNGVR